jgi:hypothetical protein
MPSGQPTTRNLGTHNSPFIDAEEWEEKAEEVSASKNRLVALAKKEAA